MVNVWFHFNFVGHEIYCLNLFVIDQEKYFTNKYETLVDEWINPIGFDDDEMLAFAPSR